MTVPRTPAWVTDSDERVYQAERVALEGEVGAFARFAQVEAWVSVILGDPRWVEELPARWSVDPPLQVAVLRRSRSATFSAAEMERPVIHLRDGSWDRLTILHELAHLASSDPSGHGPQFCAVELDLVRWFCGYHAYGALRSAFADGGVAVASSATEASVTEASGQRSGSAAARS